MRDGKLGISKKYRGKIDKVQLQYLKERIDSLNEVDDEFAFLVHSSATDAQVADMLEVIKSSGKFKEILIANAGCTISAHCGDNCVGFVAIKK